VLNRLVKETQAFLNNTDVNVERWEAYMVQRGSLLLELETLPCSADDLLNPVLLAIKAEISRQETLVHERVLTQLASVGTELRTLAVGRRALQGYGSSSSPALFERNI